MKRISIVRRGVVLLAAAIIACIVTCIPVAAQPIFKATYDGDLATVRRLVEGDASQAVRADQNGITPLHWAAGRGRTDVMRYLLEHGADANARDVRGRSALESEAREQSDHRTSSGEAEMNEISVATPVDGDNDSPDSCTPLHWAAAAGHLPAVRLLLDHGASVTAADHLRETPLHLAAQYGHPDVVAVLLERGAVVDAENTIGRTPLYIATTCESKRNRVNVMRMLIRGGADPRHRTTSGDNALSMAANHGHLDALEILLNAGADPNNVDENGQSAMHQLSNVPLSPAMLRLLLKHGADPNIADSLNRCTPLLYVSHGGLEVVKLLVEVGARVDVRSKNGDTPLHNVARFDDGTATDYLIACGVDPNLTGYRGQTPLHVAAEYWEPRTGVVHALLRGGADVNARDEKGMTPLHLAAWGGKLEIVTLLLEHSADIHAQDNEGQTALAYALRRKHDDVVNLLRKKGAK